MQYATGICYKLKHYDYDCGSVVAIRTIRECGGVFATRHREVVQAGRVVV